MLLVDVGGTLITRTELGMATRVARAVRQAVGDNPELLEVVRRSMLTAPDVDACLRALDVVPPSVRSVVASVLSEDMGQAVTLPGAEDLLRTAAALGWTVVVATNAGPGTPDLPGELERHVTATVESRGCGLVKEDPLFWTRLVDEHLIDRGMALVVGDQEDADRRAPAAAGLQSRCVPSDGSGLATLIDDLLAAGPVPPDAVAVVAGDRERWAGRDIVCAPHLESLVTRVTRARVPFSAGSSTGVAVVVRRRSQPPAVVGHRTDLPAITWLLRGRERPQYTTPASLRTLLASQGLSLDVLSPSDQRHALSVIREARTDATVEERTRDLVRFLMERGKAPADE